MPPLQLSPTSKSLLKEMGLAQRSDWRENKWWYFPKLCLPPKLTYSCCQNEAQLRVNYADIRVIASLLSYLFCSVKNVLTLNYHWFQN